MKWFKENKGAITTSVLISIGLAAIGFLSGSMAYTNSQITPVEKDISQLKADVATVTTRQDANFQEIIRRLDTIDKKLQ